MFGFVGGLVADLVVGVGVVKLFGLVVKPIDDLVVGVIKLVSVVVILLGQSDGNLEFQVISNLLLQVVDHLVFPVVDQLVPFSSSEATL